MSDSASYYTTQLAAIDAKIDQMVANPRPDYKVGDTQMNFAKLLETLYSIREKIVNRLNEMQSDAYETLNTDVNVFGQDIADYINEGD